MTAHRMPAAPFTGRSASRVQQTLVEQQACPHAALPCHSTTFRASRGARLVKEVDVGAALELPQRLVLRQRAAVELLVGRHDVDARLRARARLGPGRACWSWAHEVQQADTNIRETLLTPSTKQLQDMQAWHAAWQAAARCAAPQRHHDEVR